MSTTVFALNNAHTPAGRLAAATVNAVADAVDVTRAGRTAVNLAGSGTYALSTSEAQKPVLDASGALTGTRVLQVPLNAGQRWLVVNGTSGAYSLTVQGASGTGVQVPQGTSLPVWTDGTNVYACPAGRLVLPAVNTSVPGGNTVANTTTETNFASNFLVLANSLRVGQVLRITARGTYSTDGASPGTLTLRVKAGSTNLVVTGALTNTASLSNRGWEVTFLGVVTALGAGGTVECQGRAWLNTSASAAIAADLAATAAVTVDTTANQTLQLSAQWSVANANNTMTLRQFLVEVLG